MWLSSISTQFCSYIHLCSSCSWVKDSVYVWLLMCDSKCIKNNKENVPCFEGYGVINGKFKWRENKWPTRNIEMLSNHFAGCIILGEPWEELWVLRSTVCQPQCLYMVTPTSHNRRVSLTISMLCSHWNHRLSVYQSRGLRSWRIRKHLTLEPAAIHWPQKG